MIRSKALEIEKMYVGPLNKKLGIDIRVAWSLARWVTKAKDVAKEKSALCGIRKERS